MQFGDKEKSQIIYFAQEYIENKIKKKRGRRHSPKYIALSRVEFVEEDNDFHSMYVKFGIFTDEFNRPFCSVFLYAGLHVSPSDCQSLQTLRPDDFYADIVFEPNLDFMKPIEYIFDDHAFKIPNVRDAINDGAFDAAIDIRNYLIEKFKEL